jgi:C4-dicarboxylate transporter DctM subunit
MTALLFLSFFFLMIMGIPIAIAIGLASTLALISQDMPLVLVTQRMFAGTDSFPLIAVPFFILTGDILAKGRVSAMLVDFADSLLGFIKGGLAVVSVMASMFFAAISGSGAATTAAVGTTLVGELDKKGYNRASSVALIAASGTIGVIIPPSVPMVLYAVVANQSVAKLFLNGFIPGIVIGLTLMGIAIVHSHRNNYPRGAAFSIGNIFRTFRKAIWGIMAPVIILGGIFSGIFTPSEAAVVAVNYSILVSFFVYRDLTLRELFQIIGKSAMTMSVVMFIIATSAVFSWILANWNIPTQIAQGVLDVSANPYVIMFLIAMVLLVAGVFMETASAIIILTPVFLPLVEALGINLLHFGLIVVIGLAIGMVTPPVAINLYVASTITGLPMEKIARAIVPYLLGLLVVFLIWVYFPLFFPGLIIK